VFRACNTAVLLVSFCASLVSGQDRTAAAGQIAAVSREMATRAKVKTAQRELAAVSLLGSIATPSSANSFALSGNYAYVCDDNEIAVVNIANPALMQILGTASSPIIQNSGAIHCAVERNTLAVFTDQTGTNAGNTPGFVAFSLAV